MLGPTAGDGLLESGDGAIVATYGEGLSRDEGGGDFYTVRRRRRMASLSGGEWPAGAGSRAAPQRQGGCRGVAHIGLRGPGEKVCCRAWQGSICDFVPPFRGFVPTFHYFEQNVLILLKRRLFFNFKYAIDRA